MLGLFALALGAIVRHTAAAITGVIGFVLVLAPLAQLLPGSLGKHVHAYLPSEAGHLIAQAHQGRDDLADALAGLRSVRHLDRRAVGGRGGAAEATRRLTAPPALGAGMTNAGPVMMTGPAALSRAGPARHKKMATPGGYGGNPPGVAIIGVPTGARNTGTGAPTGDQSAGTNRTPNPP